MMFKSIKTICLVAILATTAFIAQAQKTISEGTAIYKMKSEQGDTEQKLKFNGSISNLIIENGPAIINVLNDAKEGTGMITVSVPVQQFQKAAKLTKENIKQQEDQQGTTIPSDIKATGEKQVIAGFNAEKYTFKDQDGGNFEAWVTTELISPINMFTKNFDNLIKGTVVKYTSKNGTIELKSIKEEKVGELSVTKVPDGFDSITFEELMSMQGG